MNKNAKVSLAIVTFGSFFGILSSTLMSTALPSIMKTFSITTSMGQWLTNGYILVNAIMIPTSAFLLKKFSFKNLYLFFSIIFLLGTIFGALSHEYIFLITGRMIQAIGAGVMMPLVNVMAMNSADRHNQGKIMGIIGLAFNFAPVIGPTLSGFILSVLSWRYLFILVIPFTAIDIILSITFLQSNHQETKLKFNTKGLILSSLGLLFLLYGLSNIGTANFITFNIGGSSLIGLVILILFVLTQRNDESPFINLSIFNYKQYNVAVIINMILMVTMYSNAIIIPILVQNVMHYSALQSGLVVMPGAMFTAIMSPISGRLYDRFGVKRLVISGLIIDCIGTGLQSFTTLSTSILVVTLGQTIRQMGLCQVLIPIQTQALASIPHEILPDGVATYNTLRQVAASFGTALLVGIISMSTRANPSNYLNSELIGIKIGFVVSLGMIIVCLIMTRWLVSRTSTN
ncbi:MDR family MFS transporter [Companilactobacillus nodensis]|uniref:EmrB QacA subfamily drug resistance transporter n=1 Tax=Companilactobacillus nodensis DSM 19682 = JCM 14932 = NBRC 107160 TaxID=1423775 RepID=A0A0R1K6J0_9LACO|nr:MDR family MFS transporter [Companilactobacillus nodensis]KRK79238.1 EmrB QacA subfamily drug resistance transporter [Companilactobacillus nodensis DSM 19682 = JCM 14932 = NBRC 107160]